MFKYFVSFSYTSSTGQKFGNAIIESIYRISDFDNVSDTQKWLEELHQTLYKNSNFKNIVILNINLLW